MALKFLNKKGWHTGSLRNIENVWKAEQKHEAEQRKLEELRKQIQDERERTEFRLLQEQAGLVPRQERLDFLYESGLAVGKGASDSGSGFKALEVPTAAATATGGSESSGAKAAVPGALFEDKPQSANDAWRKLHSDPLLLIRQREQEALAKIKNNPIRMAMIRKSVEAEKKQKQGKKDKGKKRKHRRHQQSELKEKRHSARHHSASDESSENEERQRRGHSPIKDHRSRRSKNEECPMRAHSDSEDTNGAKEDRREWDCGSSRYKGYQHCYSKHDKHSHRVSSDSEDSSHEEDRRQADHSRSRRHHSEDLKDDKYSGEVRGGSKHAIDYKENRRKHHQFTSERNSPEPNHDLDNKHRATRIWDKHQVPSDHAADDKHREIITQDQRQSHGYNRRRITKLSEEERAARLREMQLDAELHEEQRWKRVKKAAETDAQEAMQSRSSGGKNFLDAAQRSIFGTEKGGSSTIEESIRRRAFYSQGRSAASESNAFRR